MMATVQVTQGQQLVLDGCDWRTYTRLLRTLSRHPAVHLTYDRGTLELMTLTHEHESYGRFLGRLAVTLTEELGLPIKDGGSTTLRRRRKQRGLEPDECYWIAHEPQVRGKLQLDFRIDPPPDLAMEVDITHSSLDRLSIYAALGVPEIWHFDGQTLTFFVLGASGRYTPAPFSLALPFLKPDDLLPFLAMRATQDENAVARAFRTWVRQQLPPAAPTP
jgi:Uma2 family endonuclease